MKLTTYLEYDENCEIKPLRDVCQFKNGKMIKKEDLIDGEYPVIGGGQKPMGYHNEYNVNENSILCSSSGAYAGYISRYDKKVWASDCFSISTMSINNDYLFHYLKNIQSEIYKLQSGAGQPHVYSKNLESLEIPIPSLATQESIVKSFNTSNKLITELQNEMEQNKKECIELLGKILNKAKKIQEKTEETEVENQIILEIENDENTEDDVEDDVENQEKEIVEEPVKVNKHSKKSKSKEDKEDDQDKQEVAAKKETKYKKEELKGMGITKLKEIARELKIKGFTKYKSDGKDALIELIINI